MKLPTFGDLTPPAPPGGQPMTAADAIAGWAAWWGLPASQVILSGTGLQALPLLPAGQPDRTGRIPGAMSNLWHVGHPIFYLDAETKQRVRYDDGTLETVDAWTARLHLECAYRGVYDPASGAWSNVLAAAGLDPHDATDREAVARYAAGEHVAALTAIEFGPANAATSRSCVDATRAAYPPADITDDPWDVAGLVVAYRTLVEDLADALSPSPARVRLLSVAFTRLHALSTHGGEPHELAVHVKVITTLFARVVLSGRQLWDAIGSPPIGVPVPTTARFDHDVLTRRATIAGISGGAATAAADLRTLGADLLLWAQALGGHADAWLADVDEGRRRQQMRDARHGRHRAPMSARDVLGSHRKVAVGPTAADFT